MFDSALTGWLGSWIGPGIPDVKTESGHVRGKRPIFGYIMGVMGFEIRDAVSQNVILRRSRFFLEGKKHHMRLQWCGSKCKRFTSKGSVIDSLFTKGKNLGRSLQVPNARSKYEC